jgi:hypothetical protein
MPKGNSFTIGEIHARSAFHANFVGISLSFYPPRGLVGPLSAHYTIDDCQGMQAVARLSDDYSLQTPLHSGNVNILSMKVGIVLCIWQTPLWHRQWPEQCTFYQQEQLQFLLKK